MAHLGLSLRPCLRAGAGELGSLEGALVLGAAADVVGLLLPGLQHKQLVLVLELPLCLQKKEERKRRMGKRRRKESAECDRGETGGTAGQDRTGQDRTGQDRTGDRCMTSDQYTCGQYEYSEERWC